MPTPPADSKTCLALRAAAVLAAGWFAFSPALNGGWLWDDEAEISGNPLLRDPHGLWKIWRGQGTPDYFPLKTSFQWVEWRLWGDRVAGYHLANLGLHLAACFLLWRMLRKLGLPPGAAWLGGLLFAVHPLAVESVAWISELKNVLSLPLLLLAMNAYLDFDSRGRRFDYVRSLAWFAAAALAKPSVVFFPAVLLLHAWWRRGRIARRDLAASAPFFAVSLVLGLVTLNFQAERVIARLPIAPEGIVTRAASASMAAGFYLWKGLLPIGLLPIYPRWSLDPPPPAAFLPALAIGAALAVCWRMRTSWGRHALFGGGSFLLNLIPVAGLFPMAFLRISRVSDHLAYLPLACLAALAAAGFEAWRRAAPAIAWCCAAALVGACAWGSREYAGFFVSEEALWTHTVRHNPGAWLAHNNLGIALAKSGRLDEAIVQGREAVRLRSDLAESHSNLGLELTDAGRLPEAIAELAAALRIDPGLAGAQLNLGRALLRSGRPGEAIAPFERALRLQPGYAEAGRDLAVAHNNLGNALARSGRLDEAVAQFEESLRLSPANAGIRRNLGFALHELGRDAEGRAQIEEADRLDKGGP